MTAEGCTTVLLDDVLNEIGFGRFQWRFLGICGFGFSAAAVEVVLTAFLFQELREEWKLNDYQLSLLPTITSIGGLVGGVFWGYVADRLGRRLVFITTALIVVIFGLLSALANNLVMLIVIRTCVSFGLGGNIAIDFTLYTECLPTRGRGALVLLQAFWPTGQLMACLLAWYVIPDFGWRFFLVACAVPTVISASLRPFMPESPRWLVLNDQRELALEVCRDMCVVNGKQVEDLGLSDGVILTVQSDSLCKRKAESMKDFLLKALRLYTGPMAYTSIGLLLYSLSLHSSSYCLSTLMPTLLESGGSSSESKKNDIYMAMIFSALMQYPGVLCGGFFAVVLGRLASLRLFLLVTAAFLFAFANASSFDTKLLALGISSMANEACWCLFHTYLPEVYATEVRAISGGVIEGTGSILYKFVPVTAAHLLNTYGSAILVDLIGLFILLLGIASGILLHIETKDRDLEDSVKADY